MLLRDTLTKLWMFWDKLVVWGFLALQVYTVLSLRGIPVGIDAFQLGCIACYLLAVVLIVLIYRQYKKAPHRNHTGGGRMEDHMETGLLAVGLLILAAGLFMWQEAERRRDRAKRKAKRKEEF